MTNYIVPAVMVLVIGYGLSQKVDVFNVFISGAAEGMKVAVKLLPTFVALMTAVGMFKASGALDVLTNLLAPVAQGVGLPREVIPLALLRPISGSGALVIYEDILKSFGPDSMIGRVAGVMLGSTETTFYTIAVYFSATKVTQTRHTLPAALSADLTGFLLSAMAVRMMFY